jgi:hypothetical protein
MDPISPLNIILTILAIASPSFQLQLQSIPNITEDDNRQPQRKSTDNF